MYSLSKVFIFVLLFVFLGVSSSLASSMTNSSYEIETIVPGDNNTSKEDLIEQKISEYPTSKIIKENKYNIVIKNEENRIPFSISTSTNNISFGDIKPGEPIIRTHTLEVIPGSAPGYQIFSFINHSLQSSSKLEIPNATCDSGSCTSLLSDEWKLPLTYGFGYRCDNLIEQPCNSSFSKERYRRFSNEELNEKPAPFVKVNSGSTSKSIISLKINLSNSQIKDSYQNIIYYIATSNF